MRTITSEQARNLFAFHQCKAPADLFNGDEPFLVSFIRSRWGEEFTGRIGTTEAKCKRILEDKIGTDWSIFADLFNNNDEANGWYWEMKNPPSTKKKS